MGLLITWEDVLLIAAGEKDLANEDKFTLDLLARVTVTDVGSTSYNLTLLGQVISFQRQVEDSLAAVAAGLIQGINECRPLVDQAKAKPGRYPDEFSIYGKISLNWFEVSPGTGTTVAQSLAKAIVYGGRSFILKLCEKKVQASVFGDFTYEAQLYYAAHLAAQTRTPAQGKGSLSGQSFGGESMTFTMPNLNPKAGEVLKQTTYGQAFLELSRGLVFPMVVG